MIPLKLRVRSKQEQPHLRHRRLQTENSDLRLYKQHHPPKPHPTGKQPLQPYNYMPQKRVPLDSKTNRLVPRREGKSFLQMRTEQNQNEKLPAEKKALIERVLGRGQRLSSHTTEMKGRKREGEGRYQLERKAGSGTFGVVHRATDKQTLEIVAIKKVYQDRKYKNRELQILNLLNHPNVVKIRDSFFTWEGEKEYLNVVMDFFPLNMGEFIAQHRGTASPVPLIKQQLYTYQLFKGLLYLQDISVAHRDIKPHNILIDDRKGRLLICDFGSAKRISPSEENLAYICSRSYRAPELIFGSTKYAGHVDVWSAGCIVAEMIAQNAVFRGSSNIDQLVEIVKVIGTPSEKEVMEMNPSCDSQKFKMPLVPGTSWPKLLRKHNPSPALLDLLSKVMKYSPKERLSPVEVLQHNFFDPLRDMRTFQKLNREYKLNDLFDFSMHQNLTQSQRKQLVPAWWSQ